MNLIQMRQEVAAHGFDANSYGSLINTYINNAYMYVCRRVDYYVDEATDVLATTAGTATFPLPANFARARSLLDTDRNVELQAVGLRQIDQAATTQGTPNYYAFDGQNIRVYPTPDGVHNLEFRYWLLPNQLVNDTDTPTLPADYHSMLVEGAIARMFWLEDDEARGPAWDQKFQASLAAFEADQRFPSTDYPTQAASMWEPDSTIGQPGWSLWI